MVFKPFTHLARQSFGKTLTHGYAQSVVAATQTSTTPFAPFGSHASNKYGRPATAQHYAPFHNVSEASARSAKAGQHAVEGKENQGEGLVAYYEAWQKQQQRGEGEDKDWKQFQFPKRIEWKSPSVFPDGIALGRADVHTRPESVIDQRSLDRAYSANDADGIRKAQDKAAEAAAIAQVDEAIANVISEIQQSSSARVDPQTSKTSAPQHGDIKASPVDTERSISPLLMSAGVTAETSIRSGSSDNALASSPQQAADSYAFLDHISKLDDTQAYSEIPGVFESMLVSGIKPTVKAYNALLASAVHLATSYHRAVAKALDIHADMLYRNIFPDTAFYSTLIQLLSHRAINVSETQATVDKRHKRYGDLHEGGRNVLTSSDSEHAIQMQEDALNTAMKLFETSISAHNDRHFPAETYLDIITACAYHGRLEDMVRIYQHMESHKVKPYSMLYPPMIEAFAKSNDLNGAQMCYDQYKSLATAANAGEDVIIDRKDNEVYAALIKAYLSYDRANGALKFFNEIVKSYGNAAGEPKKQQVEAFKDHVIQNALVQHQIEAGNFSAALKIAEEHDLTPDARIQAIEKTCAGAADLGNLEVATEAYRKLSPYRQQPNEATLAMLALHCRRDDPVAAEEYWGYLNTAPLLDRSFVDPARLYASTLIKSGRVDDGLFQVQAAFRRIRGSAPPHAQAEASVQIDEAIESIAMAVAGASLRPSAFGSMALLWAMNDNGGLIAPVAEQLLPNIVPGSFASLTEQEIILALQAASAVILEHETSREILGASGFADLFHKATTSTSVLGGHVVALLNEVIAKLSIMRPDLANEWQSYQYRKPQQAHSQPVLTPLPNAAIKSAAPYTDSFDPYAASTDFKGSAIITESLDNHRNSAGLNEALNRFKNIRFAGRHPRYIAYAKLINATAKEGRINLTHEILEMARKDVPFLPEYAVVLHGWTSILDAMVGACLTAGRRNSAEQFHQEMLAMGAAPSANTFGLYITTLKESTRTFDEATEAVTIFNRALSEGVAPSSFLYNALIGKLGKARRIDDCLRYFQEMRAAGIRATSVTYGTVVNALCRVSDEVFAEQLFDQMESEPNYKPRPAPYNSMMQFLLKTKHDREKVLAYYERMQSRNIQPTMHTYTVLMETYATLEPVNFAAAEGCLDRIRADGQRPEAGHYAVLIKAKGCTLRDIDGALKIFDQVMESGQVRPQACLYQALFESMVANHCMADTEEVLNQMSANGVGMTAYIANALIHGWATENQIAKSKAVYESVPVEKKEPSTYEHMTRAYLTVEDRNSAVATVNEMCSRGYPQAVTGKIVELVGHGANRAGSFVPSGPAL